MVDTTQLDKAHVLIMGTEVPLDVTNGWHMTSDTHSSRTIRRRHATWRQPTTR